MRRIYHTNGGHIAGKRNTLRNMILETKWSPAFAAHSQLPRASIGIPTCITHIIDDQFVVGGSDGVVRVWEMRRESVPADDDEARADDDNANDEPRIEIKAHLVRKATEGHALGISCADIGGVNRELGVSCTEDGVLSLWRARTEEHFHEMHDDAHHGDDEQNDNNK